MTMCEEMPLDYALGLFDSLRVDDIIRITTSGEAIWLEFVAPDGDATHYRLIVNLATNRTTLEDLDEQRRISIE